MGDRFEAHQVGHLGQRLRLVVEQRNEFEGGIVRNPLRGRKTRNRPADLREILRRDAEQVGIISYVTLLTTIFLNQREETEEDACGVIVRFHLPNHQIILL